MKKLVAISIMAAMLLTLGVAAMASVTNWTWFFASSAADGVNGAGLNLNIGTASGALDTIAAGDTKDVAGSFTATGCVNAMVMGSDGNLYSSDFRAPLQTVASTNPVQKWTVYVWAMNTYAYNDIMLKWYSGGTTPTDKKVPDLIGGIDYSYSVKVLSNGVYGAPTVGSSEWTSTQVTGTSASPAASMKWAWTADQLASHRGDAVWAKTAGNAIVLEVTAAPPVPEPSSMLALASGLFGMAGFAIRRRK